jgi:uncharacterized OB-fold protein
MSAGATTGGPRFPVPVPERDSAPWWAAAARHELLAQECDECGTLRWPSRAICNRCGSLEWSWRALSGEATVASWMVNHHSFGAADASPYTVVLARVAEQDDVLVPGAWAGDPAGDDLSIGQAIHVTYDDIDAGVGGASTALALLRWSGTGEGESA